MALEPTFGQWLKQRRKSLDLTQDELALRVGCSLVTIQKLESGERRPSKQIAHLIAKHLNIPRDECPYFVKFARDTAHGNRQAALPELPATPGTPWRVLRRRYTNLPVSATKLIGRDQDVAAVKDRLLQDKVHLLTLVGAPGIGKTRLGIQAAEELLDDFEDGAFFVGLAPISDPNLVPMAIAQTLDVKGPPGTSLGKSVKNYLADKRLLLLLDNFEQVVSAAALVAELLTACPWLKVLVTSRVSLHVRAERQYPLSPLAVPPLELHSNLETLARYPAVELFVDPRSIRQSRLCAVRRQRGGCRANLRADGRPAARHRAGCRAQRCVAASRIVGTTEHGAALVGTAGRRTRRSARPPADSASRHPLELRFAYPREQTLFTRLGVFVGGCTLDAAKQICKDEGRRQKDEKIHPSSF
jgi:transcriptional regulator with XRE-family HTH domain